jgi:choline dehydrogenase-like flavoprotein
MMERGARAADVVVIGCGAGGGVIAKELGESGLAVVVLEAGPRFDPEQAYPTERRDFEIASEGVFRARDHRRDHYTTGGSSFRYDHVKGVGGSTLHYVAISPRLHQSDFLALSRDGVAQDWPFRYEDLEPYYTRVEWELGVSGPDGEEANPFDPPRSRRFPTPPHPFNLAGQVLKRGADRLGLHYVRDPVAIPTLDWQGRVACVGAGTCRLGCKIRAKSSIDVTYVPKAEATGRVEIRAECMAREITVDPKGRARSVVYFDREGREREIPARVIVVAGNAVETPRLLLLSRSPQFPDGLANSSGLVGRYFTEHMGVFVRGLFAERLDPWRGVPTAGLIQDFYETDPRNDFVRGWTIVGSLGHHWPLSIAREIGGWGEEHKKQMKKYFSHFVGLASIGEQIPDLRNRIELDPVVKDSHGLPVPRITSEPRENERAMIRKISVTLREILSAAGASEIWEEEFQSGASSHYMASCRMGTDPRTSVVDGWGRAHDVPNLFVADGSVFPSVGAVNPALTISAIATRTAEGILEAFERGEF